jgi:hypothetical protein
MKATCIYIFCLLILGSCGYRQNTKDQLEERVRRYLTGSLNDPRTYIPIQFNIKEQLSGSDPEFQKKSDSLVATMLEDRISFREYMRQDSLLISRYKNVLLSGWKVDHRFIYKNNSGNLSDSLITFFIDTAYNIERVQ